MAERGQLLQQAFVNAQNTFQQIQENKRAEQLFKLQRDKMKSAAEEARMQREALEQGVQGLQQAFGTPITPEQEAVGPPTAGGQMPTAGFTEQDQQQAVLDAGLNFLRSNQNDLGQRIVEETLFPDPNKDPRALLAKLAKTRAETERINADTLNKRIQGEQAKIELGTSQQFVGARQDLVSMLEAQAGEAKTPAEKFQLGLASKMLTSAQDGKAMADVLEQQFPSIQNSSGAYQAFLRNGMDPVGAFRLMQRIEAEEKAKGKTKDKNLGNDREALSQAEYGKWFLELNQAQRKAIEDELQNRRVSAKQEQIGKLPLDRVDRDQVATLLDMRDLANKAISLVTPELVGKLNAPMGRLKERFGQADPEFTSLVNTLDELVDIVARDRTGAVIGKDEIKFYSNLLGGINNEPATLVNRLTELIQRSEDRANRIVKLGTTPGAAVQQSFGLNTTVRPSTSTKSAAPPAEPEAKPTAAPAPKPGEKLSGEQEQKAIDILNKLLPGVIK